MRIDVNSAFTGQWGDNDKYVPAELYNSMKRSMEALQELTVPFMPEPTYDPIRSLLGKDFAYAFSNVLPRKRTRQIGDVNEFDRLV